MTAVIGSGRLSQADILIGGNELLQGCFFFFLPGTRMYGTHLGERSVTGVVIRRLRRALTRVSYFWCLFYSKFEVGFSGFIVYQDHRPISVLVFLVAAH